MKNIDDLVFKVCYMVAIGSIGGHSIRCKNQMKSFGFKMGLLWASGHLCQLLANFHPPKKNVGRETYISTLVLQ
jgi:hypothetical protein